MVEKWVVEKVPLGNGGLSKFDGAHTTFCWGKLQRWESLAEVER